MGRLVFSGRFTVSPPVTAEQRAELEHARRLCHEKCACKRNWSHDWFLWELSPEGDRIELKPGGHFVTRQVDGLERLIREYLQPWGCLVSGEVRWLNGGESGNESGTVYSDRNRVECVWGVPTSRSPS